LPSADLPKHSEEIRIKLNAFKQKEATLVEISETNAEYELIEKLKILKEHNLTFPRILMTDDEPLYRNGFESLLRRGHEFFKEIPFSTAQNSNEAYQMIEKFKPDIIIQDIDLGSNSHNGIQIIKNLRSSNFMGKICVHSNRFLMGDQNEAILSGADLVLPKPMSRAHLLKLISSCLGEVKRMNTKNEKKLKPKHLSIARQLENAYGKNLTTKKQKN
jgi:DNA-binding NarL/FixJ family response regulator